MDRNVELRIGLVVAASLLTACAMPQRTEAPTTPEQSVNFGPRLDEITPDVSDILSRRNAQGGYVYGS